MGKECKIISLQLQAANIYIRVCGGEAEVSISPVRDTIGRHEYTAVGTVEEVVEELKQLAEDILKAVERQLKSPRTRLWSR
jgi:hypothetical protein